MASQTFTFDQKIKIKTLDRFRTKKDDFWIFKRIGRRR